MPSRSPKRAVFNINDDAGKFFIDKKASLPHPLPNGELAKVMRIAKKYKGEKEKARHRRLAKFLRDNPNVERDMEDQLVDEGELQRDAHGVPRPAAAGSGASHLSLITPNRPLLNKTSMASINRKTARLKAYGRRRRGVGTIL